LIIPLFAACGTGIVRVIGLWNFRRLGSIVITGETATQLPSSLAVSSAGHPLICGHVTVEFIDLITCKPTLIFFVNAPGGKTACT